MANPYAGKAKSTSAAKAKAISGRSTAGKVFDGAPLMKAMKKAHGGSIKDDSGEVFPGGKRDPHRPRPQDGSSVVAEKARGGGVKGKTNITINIQGGGKEPMPMPIPIPAGPPPGPPPGPDMPGPMTGAPQLGPPPMMRKAGGRVKMTAGAETGKGRLQKAAAYKRG